MKRISLTNKASLTNTNSRIHVAKITHFTLKNIHINKEIAKQKTTFRLNVSILHKMIIRVTIRICPTGFGFPPLD